MSTNCIKCGIAERTGTDLKCTPCRNGAPTRFELFEMLELIIEEAGNNCQCHHGFECSKCTTINDAQEHVDKMLKAFPILKDIRPLKMTPENIKLLMKGEGK